MQYARSLNLEEVTRYYRNTCSNRNSEQMGKLDDRLEPLPAEIHGAVVRTSSERLREYELEGE